MNYTYNNKKYYIDTFQLIIVIIFIIIMYGVITVFMVPMGIFAIIVYPWIVYLISFVYRGTGYVMVYPDDKLKWERRSPRRVHWIWRYILPYHHFTQLGRDMLYTAAMGS